MGFEIFRLWLHERKAAGRSVSDGAPKSFVRDAAGVPKAKVVVRK